ncbi:hypothetical protein, partial [Escherichia coli]|uniref:hypothetical protein n=1 Tax=Escherichia coli TaxID=562 RepID=UPI001BDC06B8
VVIDHAHSIEPGTDGPSLQQARVNLVWNLYRPKTKTPGIDRAFRLNRGRGPLKPACPAPA